jgi:hypothetical protein
VTNRLRGEGGTPLSSSDSGSRWGWSSGAGFSQNRCGTSRVVCREGQRRGVQGLGGAAAEQSRARPRWAAAWNRKEK